MAERKNGAIGRPVPFDYVWGDAVDALAALRPSVRIVNLETAVTQADRPWPKGINYRMSPANVRCLTAFGVDCCVVANNHVLDWGQEGLLETLHVLRAAHLNPVGAGRNREEAASPAVLSVPSGRVVVYAFACPSSGVPADWNAGGDQAGVNFLPKTTRAAAEPIVTRIIREKRAGDVVVCSMHWGSNWGYEISSDQRGFARALIDSGVVDIVYGHSSHHPKAIEVYCGKPILYGCGDFLNDYEGIADHESYRGDLVLMYLVKIDDQSGLCVGLDLIPFHIRRFRLDRAEPSEIDWLQRVMDRECGRFGGKVSIAGGNELRLSW